MTAIRRRDGDGRTADADRGHQARCAHRGHTGVAAGPDDGLVGRACGRQGCGELFRVSPNNGGRGFVQRTLPPPGCKIKLFQLAAPLWNADNAV